MKEKLEFEKFLIQANGVKNAIYDSVIKSGSVDPRALILGKLQLQLKQIDYESK